jgi:anaerobic selenocysteine-containing dehydrogenase
MRRKANPGAVVHERMALHPTDAARLDVRDGTEVVVSSRAQAYPSGRASDR